MSYKFLIILPLILLTACQNLHPLPVDEVDIENKLNEDDDGKEVGLGEASDTDDAIDNMKTYSQWYFKKANELREYAYKADDRSLGFAMAGLVAGVTKSPEGAAAGALLSSVVGMPVDRYQLGVQAANYEKASDVMHCMYRILSPNRQGSLPDVRFLNDKIYEVRRKLRKAQTSVTLVAPDLSELEEHMKEIVNKKKEIAENEEAIAKAKNAKSNTSQLESAHDALERKRFEEEVGACVAQM